ncbi:MAG TPA: DUF5362 domain-containing protein [Clostridiales bacterium]|jgi:beta-lactamase regulating signal transducer with metallopeptidase domain|nr:DUF5362 domain-containing protein [Clostridiales bacterium]
MLEKQQLVDVGRWSGFVGIITLISGILSCITIVGIIPGVVAIILGLKLRNVKRFAEEAASSLDEMSQTSRLNLMLSDLSGYFKIQGILIIIGLVLAVIGIIVAIAAGIFFSNLNYNYYF